MPEIKKDLVKLEEGTPYVPGPDEYVITENHTISDIIRYAISCTNIEEVKTVIDMIADDT